MTPDMVLPNRIYTDGSAVQTPNGKMSYGIGIFSKSPPIAYSATVTPVEAHDNPSINAAELLAIRKTLALLANLPPSRYEIVSDSSFALQSIQRG